jgi:hypothetical protein
MVAVMMLGRLFCFAANDPGTYEPAPAEEVCESRETGREMIINYF